MPVGEMLNRMSSAEITEWMAYYALERDESKPKTTSAAELRAAFAHRVKRKE